MSRTGMYPGRFERGAAAFQAAMNRANRFRARYQCDVYAEEDPGFPLLLWMFDNSTSFNYDLDCTSVRLIEHCETSPFFGRIDNVNPPPLAFKIAAAPNGVLWDLSFVNG